MVRKGILAEYRQCWTNWLTESEFVFLLSSGGAIFKRRLWALAYRAVPLLVRARALTSRLPVTCQNCLRGDRAPDFGDCVFY